MVIRIREPGRIALLDNRLVYGRIKDDLRGGRITTSASASGRDVNRGNFDPALVVQGQSNRALVITHLGAHREHGIRLDPVDRCRYHPVLNRVRTLRIERLIGLRHIDVQRDIAGRIRSQLLAIEGHLFDRTLGAVLLPSCRSEE